MRKPTAPTGLLKCNFQSVDMMKDITFPLEGLYKLLFLLIVGLLGHAHVYAQNDDTGQGLRISTFDVDATPPIGDPLTYDSTANSWDLGLRAKGIVLLGAGQPIVLVADIQGNGSSYNFVVTLSDTRTGIPISQVAQNCAVCTIEEAISTATLTTISVLTGTGDAKSSADASLLAGAESKTKPSPGPGALRRSGLIFLGAGAIGILAGAYVFREQDRDIGLVTLSSGAGLVTGGATMLLLSRRF